MPFTVYDATIVMAQKSLKTLRHILQVSEKHPSAANLPTATLYEDMYPLTGQIHVGTYFTERMLAKFEGREPEKLNNDLLSYADMYARIDKALKALDKIDRDLVNESADVVAPTRLWQTVEMSGTEFAMSAAIPTIFFHTDMAYAILRKEGVPLGKRDQAVGFLGPNQGR